MAGTLKERMRVNEILSEVSLSANGELRWRRAVGGAELSLTVESEVLGFAVCGKEIRINSFVDKLKGFSCGGKGGFGNKLWKDYVLEMPTAEAADRWSDRLRDCINSLGRPKRLFIIVNPYGGKKSAQNIFHAEIKPLLVAANIFYTLQETKYQLHAEEIVFTLDLLKYDGIVCVSGDGVLVEVVNGLLKRKDWDTAIKMPLGIIPAGTGNGLAKSLLDAVSERYSIQHAAFAIIRGHKRFLDVTTILQGETKYFSILMLTWGFLADVDIESEKHRWMGSSRLEFYSFQRVMKLRKYHGRVEFVPAPGYEAYGEVLNDNGSFTSQLNIAEILQRGYNGPKTHFDHLDWRFLEGPFISVSAVNVPWIGEDVKPAPQAKFSDGFLDLVIIKHCSKPALISILLKLNDGSHVKSPHVMYLKVKAFRLAAGNRVESPAKGGIIDVDGEVIARGEGIRISGRELMTYASPIQLTVDKGLATLFTPSPR